MGDKSTIEWTDATWNPVTGCSQVSPGCDHCYAEALSLRYGWSKKPWTPENAEENVVLHPERLRLPGTWRKPRMVFVNSMSDLFHPRVPSSFINDVWMAMFNNPRHTYQILTKRPKRMRDWTIRAAAAKGWPVDEIWPDWIWIGTSIESRDYIGRADLLRETPAAVRFISAEPPTRAELRVLTGRGRGCSTVSICTTRDVLGRWSMMTATAHGSSGVIGAGCVRKSRLIPRPRSGGRAVPNPDVGRSDERETYYAWRSDSREVSTVEASSARAAAEQYAMRDRVPYNIALRVVAVRDVRSFGIRVKESGVNGEPQP